MQLSKIIAFSFMACVGLFGSDSLNNILSDTKNEIFDTSAKKVKEDADKLEKDWISPINLSYSYTLDVASQTKESNIAKASILIDQPIFKSGGIGYAIKYANATYLYAHLDVALQKKTMIKDAVKILFQIKQTDLSIQKQTLVVQNANLDVKTKQEQVIHGVMDASFLDNAIIDANAKKVALADLQTQKESLIYQFKNYSDKEYSSLELPTLALVDEETFITQNSYIAKNKEEAIQKEWYAKMIQTKYLPSINATYTYNYYPNKSDGINDAYYGLKASIPLDIRYSNETTSAKLDYLKSKATGKSIQMEEENLYKTKLAKLANIEKKIALAKEDVELYKKLVFQVKELASVGLKTNTDKEILENSLRIKSMDEGILNVDKQVELLELYARYGV